MINLSLNELKLIAKNRDIKDYENKSKDDLIKILREPRTKSLSKKRIKKIREKFNELRDRLKEIRRNIYDIKNPKNLSASKTKEIERNLLELEESLFKPRKYYDYDDIKYKGIRDVRNVFHLSIAKDYYKPKRTNRAFNGNYTEYERKGDKDKALSIIEYLKMIRPYLGDIINNHKTQGEWKIQLTLIDN